jgi:hypothetical protein
MPTRVGAKAAGVMREPVPLSTYSDDVSMSCTGRS